MLITADTSLGIRGAAVAVDFSSGGAVPAHAQACAAARVPILIGATGLDAAGRGALERAAQDVAVLIAPNTSVGVSVMADWCRWRRSAWGRRTMWRSTRRTTT